MVTSCMSFKLGMIISMLAYQPIMTDVDFLLLCDKIFTTVKMKRKNVIFHTILVPVSLVSITLWGCGHLC